MPITQILNSKANVKKTTTQDLPFAPQQPVINVYRATSTAGQSTIANLGFQINVNDADTFWLMIDGKKLTLGSTGDYQFSAVSADGFSSTVSFNVPLSSGLNIEAFKLGYKKESEFGVDNRISGIYEVAGASFQGFVDTSKTLTATGATGTPAAGTFHSTISGRAPIVDMTQDLKPRMGVERVMIQSINQLQNEFGPNSEPVWATPNDLLGQIRFVGSWLNSVGSSGAEAYSATANDFVEITFYGTGLNLITFAAIASLRSAAITVDGVSAGTFTQSTTSTSTVLQSRNYSPNSIVSIVNGLSLGIHTVRLTVANLIDVFGFEILTETTSLRVQPGVSYLSGKKATTTAQQTVSYNSGFESGTLGTRGGRVVVYQKADGTIAKAVQPVNASQANYTSADHSNEEVARTYYPREFGAGRTDDFSTLASSGSNRSFTLDDGTTTLTVQNYVLAPAVASYGEGLGLATGVGDVLNFTFVGTGLDMTNVRGTSGSTTYTIIVDGTTIVTATNIMGSGLGNTIKIISGLPYGTHTVRITVASISGAGLYFGKLIVYQPKKPAIPVGAVELADYNVMADYNGSTITGTTVADNTQMPTGCLFKAPTREYAYSGANWSLFPVDATSLPGLTTTTGTNNTQPIVYSFFGTGLVVHFGSSVGGTYDFSVSIDGSLNATGVARSNASNLGAGSYRSTASSTAYLPCRVEFTGLSLGLHTVTIQRTAGSGNFTFQGLHIITPIHSPKPNLYADLQNTLLVGSQGISDNRKLSAVKESDNERLPFAQAIGIGSITTTSTLPIPMTNMSVTITAPKAGYLDLRAQITATGPANNGVFLQFYVDGSPVGVAATIYYAAGNAQCEETAPLLSLVPVSAGVHKVDVYWWSQAAVSLSGQSRSMSALFRK